MKRIYLNNYPSRGAKPCLTIRQLVRDHFGLVNLPIGHQIPRLSESTRDVLFIWI